MNCAVGRMAGLTSIIVIALVVLFVVGKKSVHTEILISASPKMVWDVLTDVEKHPEWNTVLVPVGGVLIEGEEIQYEFSQDSETKSIIPAKVKKIKLQALLNQTGGLPLVLTFDHQYKLEEQNGNTKLTIHEDYRGIAVPFWNPRQVETAYKQLGQDLKSRVESLKLRD